jgi:hypothetical protein
MELPLIERVGGMIYTLGVMAEGLSGKPSRPAEVARQQQKVDGRGVEA